SLRPSTSHLDCPLSFLHDALPILILPNHDEAEAVAFAEKVRSRIASRQFQVGDKTETLTISGGVALWPKYGATYDAVLLKANQRSEEHTAELHAPEHIVYSPRACK